MIKKINRTTCLAVALVALGLAGCASNDGKPASQSWSDSRTSKRVEGNLKQSATYKFPNVRVSTDNGITQLSGFVDTEQQKKDAVERAQNTSGVRGVVDNLVIRTMPTGRAPVVERPREINPEEFSRQATNAAPQQNQNK